MEHGADALVNIVRSDEVQLLRSKDGRHFWLRLGAELRPATPAEQLLIRLIISLMKRKGLQS
jgi:hypothetical protein